MGAAAGLVGVADSVDCLLDGGLVGVVFFGCLGFVAPVVPANVLEPVLSDDGDLDIAGLAGDLAPGLLPALAVLFPVLAAGLFPVLACLLPVVEGLFGVSLVAPVALSWLTLALGLALEGVVLGFALAVFLVAGLGWSVVSAAGRGAWPSSVVSDAGGPWKTLVRDGRRGLAFSSGLWPRRSSNSDI